MGTEIPELLNKNWQLLSNRQSKLEILRQYKVLLSDWKKSFDRRERNFHIKMQNEQPLQPSSVLETPKSNPSVDPELNSSTMMYGDENPNELQRIEDERKKQQEEQMMKLDADFKADLLVEEKSFE